MACNIAILPYKTGREGEWVGGREGGRMKEIEVLLAPCQEGAERVKVYGADQL